jgi:hypothetical protein
MELQTLFRRESAAYNKNSLYFSLGLMASPLFRFYDPNLAGWKTGSNKIVGLKMAVL